MRLFHKVEDAIAIVKQKGLYRQVDVYHRGGNLYVKHGSGFAGLLRDPMFYIGTTVPGLGVDDLYLPLSVAKNGAYVNDSGRICMESAEGKKTKFALKGQ